MRLDQRVIVGELPELAGSQQVRAAVADVREMRAVSVDDARRERGPHAPTTWRSARALEDRRVRELDHAARGRPAARGTGPRSSRARAATRPRRLDGHPCRRRPRTAEARTGRSPRCPRGRAPMSVASRPDPHRRSSSTVVPTRIRSPGWTHRRRGEPLVVHERAVRRAEVLHVPAAFGRRCARAAGEAYVSSTSELAFGRAADQHARRELDRARLPPSGSCTTTAWGRRGRGRRRRLFALCPAATATARPSSPGPPTACARQMNRYTRASRPYFDRREREGRHPSTLPRGTRARWCRS